jgi:hypothetical protein
MPLQADRGHYMDGMLAPSCCTCERGRNGDWNSVTTKSAQLQSRVDVVDLVATTELMSTWPHSNHDDPIKGAPSVDVAFKETTSSPVKPLEQGAASTSPDPNRQTSRCT